LSAAPRSPRGANGEKEPKEPASCEPRAASRGKEPSMYLVTKRIEFCYGHRLLDYDGICKHPHGHNAVAEIDVRTDRLDARNMVADFSDIKRLVKGWIDRELDHKMILRHDDPLVAPLQALGEPLYLLESNPTVERIARLIFEKTAELGFQVVSVRVWETPSSFAAYSTDN
jgi:6-pyruvoyltetrahydropterin/6-carboxytetrahydropterin synthase